MGNARAHRGRFRRAGRLVRAFGRHTVAHPSGVLLVVGVCLAWGGPAAVVYGAVIGAVALATAGAYLRAARPVRLLGSGAHRARTGPCGRVGVDGGIGGGRGDRDDDLGGDGRAPGSLGTREAVS